MSFRRDTRRTEQGDQLPKESDMDERAGALGEIAADAAIERSSFLADAAEQLKRFIDANRGHIKDVGGMVLIDDDPDYLSIAPDGTFRSRTRYQDEATGEWFSETEVIESAAELVELYNLAEVYAAFGEAARDEAGVPGEIAASEELVDATSLAPADKLAGSYAGAADDWAAKHPQGEPADAQDAARRLYDLALTFQERSQHAEARMIEQFELAATDLAPFLGDVMVLDDEDERLWFRSNGSFEAEVVPQPDDEGEPGDEWRTLSSPDQLVEFYDPTDVFGDFAEALVERFPSIAANDDEGGEPA
ncbi:hypothetical protein BH23CHL7_BH23CHL7_09500 [soil metagenome]